MKKIIYKSKDQINAIRESGKYLTELLSLLYKKVEPGVCLKDLEKFAQDYLNRNSLKGAFKGYYGFPANLCLSVNDCVVHGIPNSYELKDGDLLKVDAGVVYKKGISDSAFSKVVGGESKSKRGQKLINSTKNGLDKSIKGIGPGVSIYDFSSTIYKHIKSDGFEVLKNLTGHGVGVNVHEGPFIYNWPHPDTKKINFKSGMVLAFEPITSEKSSDFKELSNIEWSIFTKNGDLGAQREYTVVITDNGYEILAGLTGDY